MPHCTLARVCGSGHQGMIRPTFSPGSKMLRALVWDPIQTGYMLVISFIGHSASWSSPGEDKAGVAEISFERGALDGYLACSSFVCSGSRSASAPGSARSDLTCGATKPKSAHEAAEPGFRRIIPKSCFVGHGVFSICHRCGPTIDTGIMYYGCGRKGRKCTAACQELSFHHFQGFCDHSDDAHSFPGFVSRSWSDHARQPQQEIPGADQGVTG